MNPALRTLEGLETIRRVVSLGVVAIPIGSLAGLGVDEVSGGLGIDSTDLPELVLSEFLTVTPPSISILRNTNLTSVNLTGDSLRMVNIAENGALETVSIDYSLGVPNVTIRDEPTLTTLDLKLDSRTAQRVSLLRTGLQNIGGSNLTAIQPRPSETGEGLFIQENPALTDIGAFQAITSYNRFLVIRDNPQLCVPQGFHDVSVTQSRTIVSNGSCQ